MKNTIQIEKIKSIVNSSNPESLQMAELIDYFSNSDDFIPFIMKVYNEKMKEQKDLLIEMNVELSRAQVKINQPTIAETPWILDQIKDFYTRWKHKVRHSFNAYPDLYDNK